MSGILDLLNSDLGKTLISGAASQAGQSTDKTSAVLKMGLPLLMGALKDKTEDPKEGAGLLESIDKNDGSILDNIGSFFDGGVDDSAMSEGSNLIGTLLGSKANDLTSALSAKSGMDAGSIMKILSVAAPIVMGFLGKETSAGNGVAGILGNLVGGGSKGDMLGSIAGMMLGGDDKKEDKGGDLLGDVMGGIFGK